MSHVIPSFLFGISPTDPVAIVGTVIFLARPRRWPFLPAGLRCGPIAPLRYAMSKQINPEPISPLAEDLLYSTAIHAKILSSSCL